jgi:hypothetical protein
VKVGRSHVYIRRARGVQRAVDRTDVLSAFRLPAVRSSIPFPRRSIDRRQVERQQPTGHPHHHGLFGGGRQGQALVMDRNDELLSPILWRRPPTGTTIETSRPPRVAFETSSHLSGSQKLDPGGGRVIGVDVRSQAGPGLIGDARLDLSPSCCVSWSRSSRMARRPSATYSAGSRRATDPG